MAGREGRPLGAGRRRAPVEAWAREGQIHCRDKRQAHWRRTHGGREGREGQGYGRGGERVYRGCSGSAGQSWRSYERRASRSADGRGACARPAAWKSVRN
jgi:hypothetical protein